MTPETTTTKGQVSSKKGSSIAERMDFLGQYLRNPRSIGSLTPSSNDLTDALLQDLDLKNARLIVELGPGTGPVTKKIIERMGKQTSLVCFELNSNLCSRLQDDLRGSRTFIVNKSALEMPAYLRMLAYGKADYVISGLPLKSLKQREEVLDAVVDSLAPRGVFTQFQYAMPFLTGPVEELLARHFLSFEKRQVYWNLPPATVYTCSIPLHPPSASR
jgi:phospholipid N-methyltransferase